MGVLTQRRPPSLLSYGAASKADQNRPAEALPDRNGNFCLRLCVSRALRRAVRLKDLIFGVAGARFWVMKVGTVFSELIRVAREREIDISMESCDIG